MWPRKQSIAKSSGDSFLVNNITAWITSAHQYSQLKSWPSQVISDFSLGQRKVQILHYHFFLLKQLFVRDGGSNGQWQQIPTRGRAIKLHHFPQHHESQLSVQVLTGKYSHANIYLLTYPTPKSWLTWTAHRNKSQMKRDKTELQKKLTVLQMPSLPSS